MIKMNIISWFKSLLSKRRKQDRKEIILAKEAASGETIKAVTAAKPSILPSQPLSDSEREEMMKDFLTVRERDVPRPTREELVKQQTDRIKETFLPAPQTKRRVFPSHEHIPAAQHSDRIGKLMGKHGGRMSKSYRRSVKARKSIEEEDD